MFQRPVSAMQAKYSRYRANGGGRDSYIARGYGYNNESTNLSSNMQVTGAKMNTNSKDSWNYSINTNQQRYIPSSNAQKTNGAIRYNSDGSGRDSYIVRDLGGSIRQSSSSKSTQDFFKASLRGYDIIPHPTEYFSKIDCQKTGQLWRTRRTLTEQSGLANSQSNLTKRLSQPKQSHVISNQKYRNLRSASNQNFTYKNNNYSTTDNNYYPQQNQNSRENNNNKKTRSRPQSAYTVHSRESNNSNNSRNQQQQQQQSYYQSIGNNGNNDIQLQTQSINLDHNKQNNQCKNRTNSLMSQSISDYSYSNQHVQGRNLKSQKGFRQIQKKIV